MTSLLLPMTLLAGVAIGYSGSTWPEETQAIASVLAFLATIILVVITWQYTKANDQLLALETQRREDAGEIRSALDFRIEQPTIGGMPPGEIRTPTIQLVVANLSDRPFFITWLEVTIRGNTSKHEIHQIAPLTEVLTITIGEEFSRLALKGSSDFTKIDFEDTCNISLNCTNGVRTRTVGHDFRLTVVAKMGGLNVFKRH